MYISSMTLIIPILQVRSLTHLHTLRVADADLSRTVFRNLNFDIYQGETVGLHGLRMERMSVLMQCLAKLIKPAEGRIVWNICSDPQRRFPDIAYLPRCQPDHEYFRTQSHFPSSSLPPSSDGGLIGGGSIGRGLMTQPISTVPTILLIDGVADSVTPTDQVRLGQLFTRLNAIGKTVIIGCDKVAVLQALTNRIIHTGALERGRTRGVPGARACRHARLTSLSDQSPLS